MDELDILEEYLSEHYGEVSPRDDYGWQNPALNVLDCVLSLHRPYQSLVFPRLKLFKTQYPAVFTLQELSELFNAFGTVQSFVEGPLNYRDPDRARVLKEVVDYLMALVPDQNHDTLESQLHAWAQSVHPSDYKKMGVKGFALSGFQYLRMLFGVQTVKPDVHILQFVQELVGYRLNDLHCVELLELAAAHRNLPLREIDACVWQARSGGSLFLRGAFKNQQEKCKNWFRICRSCSISKRRQGYI